MSKGKTSLDDRKDLHGKTFKHDSVAYPSNFRRPLQSLLLRHTAENLEITKFLCALSACANKIFQKRTVFVFTENWSRDQLMPKARSRLASAKAYGRQGFQTLTLFKTSNRSFRCPSAAAFRFAYKINYFFAEKLASWNKIFWKNCW